jgi:hypothetical protein
MGAVYQRNLIFAIVLSAMAVGAASAQSGNPAGPEVPADFPKDCPVFQNSIFRDYQMARRQGVKIGTILVLETPAAPSAIGDFYKKAMVANGWNLLKHPKNPSDLLEGTKGPRHLIIGVISTRQGANPTTTFRVVALDKHS